MDTFSSGKIHNLSDSPKEAWKSVNILKDWIHDHHKTPDIMRFQLPNSTFSSTNEEHVEILCKHFLSLYNSKVNIYWKILDELSNKEINTNLDIPLSLKEFKWAIKKLTLHKNPGLNRVPPNAIKALNEENIQVLFDINSRYFEGNFKIEEWQIGRLKILPQKDDLTNVNNWRGINLLEVMSIVITTRLQVALLEHGIPTQFGSSPKTECSDGSFSLRTLLHLRKEHDLNSWVVFVDLIKAFDSIHHSLLFLLLKKIGIPDRVIKVIKNLYNDFKTEIKVGDVSKLIDYRSGVK